MGTSAVDEISIDLYVALDCQYLSPLKVLRFLLLTDSSWTSWSYNHETRPAVSLLPQRDGWRRWWWMSGGRVTHNHWKSRNSPTLKLRSSLGSKKKYKKQLRAAALVSHATLFLEVINQKAPLFCTLATRNSNTYPSDIISRVFWRAYVLGWRGWRGLGCVGWRGVTGIPDPTLSAHCWRDLQESPRCSRPRRHRPSNPYPLMGSHYLAIYKRYLFPLVRLLTVGRVKVKAGSDTMIHTPQLKDSLHLN